MHRYSSDIDRARFPIITLILKSSCRTTSPRILAEAREKSITQKVYLKKF